MSASQATPLDARRRRRPRRVGRVRARRPRPGAGRDRPRLRDVAGACGRQRRAFVHLDASAERTITVIGERMGPHGSDELPWDELAQADGVYFTAGDADAVRKARAAQRLVATTRANEVLVPAHVQLDVLVRSARDPGEQYVQLDPAPRFVAETNGALGGTLVASDGATTHWPAAPLPGPAVDAYGAGDSFAAGLTFGLAKDLQADEAVRIGARCGATVMTGRGPYSARLAPSS